MIRLSTSIVGKSTRQSNTATRKLLLQHQQQQIRSISSIDEPSIHYNSNNNNAQDVYRKLSTQPSSSSDEFRSWQASHNIDIQRVTQTAMIHELTQQQTRSIEKVVPWFLATMPAPYFRQVPESFRLDHIKAISAIKDANMDMHMNLKTHLPDGRQVRIHLCWLQRSIDCNYILVHVNSHFIVAPYHLSYTIGAHIHSSRNHARITT